MPRLCLCYSYGFVCQRPHDHEDHLPIVEELLDESYEYQQDQPPQRTFRSARRLSFSECD